jgi:hypothetical protein
MQRTKTETKRTPTPTTTLASHYRAIGPAAVAAALLCQTKTKKQASGKNKAA